MQINRSLAGSQTAKAALEIGHDWTAKVRISKVELPDFVLKARRKNPGCINPNRVPLRALDLAVSALFGCIPRSWKQFFAIKAAQ
jgi:hypothetical protein